MGINAASINATIIVVDIEKFSKRDTFHQLQVLNAFNASMKTFIDILKKSASVKKRIATGDGLAIIVCLGDSSVFNLVEIIDNFIHGLEIRNEEAHCQTFQDNGWCNCKSHECCYNIRIGIYDGPVVAFKDVNGDKNYAGTPINAAFRIVDGAHRNKLVISHEIFDRITGFDASQAEKFVPSNLVIKHGENLKIYTYDPGFRKEEENQNILTNAMTERLNALFVPPGKAKILGRPKRIPKLHPMYTKGDSDEYPIEDPDIARKISDSYEAFCRQDKLNRGINSPCAILVNGIDQANDQPTLYYQSTNYLTVRALRNSGKKPPIISASALLFSTHERTLLLHRRSPRSATYPGCFHTFGGAYMPHTKNATIDDGKSLLKTMKRELVEETGFVFHWQADTPLLLIEELETGFIQLAFVAVPVHEEERQLQELSWEGYIEAIPFDQLETFILRQAAPSSALWVPTGLLLLLYWLGLGAPGCEKEERFSGKSAHKLFETIMKELEISKYTLSNFLGCPNINHATSL